MTIIISLAAWTFTFVSTHWVGIMVGLAMSRPLAALTAAWRVSRWGVMVTAAFFWGGFGAASDVNQVLSQ